MSDPAIQLGEPTYALTAEQRKQWDSTDFGFDMRHGLLLCNAPVEQLRDALQHVVCTQQALCMELRASAGLKVPQQWFNPDKKVCWESSDAEDPITVAQQCWACRVDALPVVAQLLSSAQAAEIADTSSAQLASQEKAETHWLLLSLPAIVADTATVALMAAQLEAILCNERPDEEALPFEDYIDWQENTLIDSELVADRDLALQGLGLLDGESEPLQLAVQDRGCSDGHRREVHWKSELSPDTLTALLSHCGSTDRAAGQMLFGAIWRVLLWRLGHRQALRLMLPADLRLPIEDLASTAGPLTAALAMTGNLRAETDVLSLAHEMLARLRAAEDWIEFHPAYVQTGAPDAALEFTSAGKGAACSLLWQSVNRLTAPLCAQFDLGFSNDGLKIQLSADTNIYSYQALATIGRALVALCNSVAENPRLALGEHGLLDCEDFAFYRRLSATSLDGTVPTLLQAFYRQVDAQPTALAVRGGDEALDYQSLNERAAAMASAILEYARAGSVVALGLDRGVDMVSAILACAKAGVTYTPLDPANAPARLEYQLQHSGAVMVLVDAPTQAQLIDRLPQEAIALPMLVTDSIAAVDTDSEPFLRAHETTESLAYIVYTSGSTGLPKGVAVSHKSVAVYLRSVSSRLDWQPGQTFATVSTISADLGNTVILGSLYAGGELSVIDYTTATDGDLFANFCAAHPIDVLKIVPSHFESLWQTARPQRRQNLLPSQLIFGGEVLSRSLVDDVLAVQPDTQVVNHYGPTETTIGVLMAGVAAGADSAIPLGTPNPGTAMMLCDVAGEPLPAGCCGELYIGGQQLAEAYWNEPGLTQERFLKREWISSGNGADGFQRWYRSGDCVWFDGEGQAHYAGRCDQQVKIRGYRVELGEIDRCVGDLEGVRSCVTHLFDQWADASRAAESRLVAYLVLDEGSRMDLGELRTSLAHKIPDYMLPQHLVLLPRLPLNRNGKLDRSRLPAPEVGESASYCAPRCPLEKDLSRLFAQVLDRPKVGVLDDFFALGGHSLGAVRIAALVRQHLCPQLATTALFDYPSVAMLAAHVRELKFEPAGQSPPREGLFVPLNEPVADVLLCVASNTRRTLRYVPLANALSGRYHVVALDPRTLVWSSQLSPASHGSIAESGPVYAAALTTYLAGLFPDGITSLHLLGWSFGGVLAQQIAASMGEHDLLHSLTIVDSRLHSRDANTAADPLLRYTRHLPHKAQLALQQLPESQLDSWRARIASAPADSQVTEALAIAQENGLFDGDTTYGPDDMREYMEAEEHFHRLLEHHRVSPCAVPLNLIWASETLANWREQAVPAPQWSDLCGQPAAVYELPASHDNILAQDAFAHLVDDVLQSHSERRT